MSVSAKRRHDRGLIAPLRLVAGILVLASAAYLLSCGSGVPIRYYTLERAAGSGTSGADGTAGALRVDVGRVVVAAPYDQDRIAYRPPGSRHEIAFYHYHRWALAPADLFTSQLAAALDRIDGIEVGSAGESTVELAVRIDRLEEVDDSEDSIRVVLGMTVDQVGVGAEDGARRLAAPLTLSLEAPVASPDVESVVDAFADTLDQAARRIADALRAD